MYKLINKNIDAVIDAAEELGIAAYSDLRASLGIVDVSKDAVFQKRYRDYWRMNVGRFGPAFYEGYFGILSECQRLGSADLRRTIQTLTEMGAETRGLQFSFATKLVHMIDPRVPVYDAYVAGFYFYVPPTSKTRREERISDLLSFHAFLRKEYQRVIEQRLLAKSISEFRLRQPDSEGIPDERIIDWLIWGWVSHLRSGAQHRNEALYE
jgi:hypothetical protein